MGRSSARPGSRLRARACPKRTTGLVAALAPRAHAGLTRDPLGLVASAVAAGLGLAYLVLATSGASRRVRLVVPVLAAALLVLVPVLFLAGLGARTGVVRAQDPVVVQAAADASRLLQGRSPYTPPPDSAPRGREAVSASFRLDPPAEWLPVAPLVPSGPAVLSALARLLGVRDLRLVTVAALWLLAVALAVRFTGRRRRTAVAVALVLAPLALGTVLGAPFALSLLALVSAWAARDRGALTLAGALAGVAVGLEHRALLVAPFLALPGPGAGLARPLVAAVAGYGLLVAPGALLDVRAFLEQASAPSAPGPGLGLVNLLAYWGAENVAVTLAPVAMLAALGACGWLLTRPWPKLARAGIASLLGIVLAPSLGADAVAAPILLLTLAALVPSGGVGEQRSNGQQKDGQRRTRKRTHGKTAGTGLEGGIPPP